MSRSAMQPIVRQVYDLQRKRSIIENRLDDLIKSPPYGRLTVIIAGIGLLLSVALLYASMVWQWRPGATAALIVGIGIVGTVFALIATLWIKRIRKRRRLMQLHRRTNKRLETVKSGRAWKDLSDGPKFDAIPISFSYREMLLRAILDYVEDNGPEMMVELIEEDSERALTIVSSVRESIIRSVLFGLGRDANIDHTDARSLFAEDFKEKYSAGVERLAGFIIGQAQAGSPWTGDEHYEEMEQAIWYALDDVKAYIRREYL